MNDEKKGVGKEADTYTQAEQAFGNWVDNEAAGVEFD